MPFQQADLTNQPFGRLIAIKSLSKRTKNGTLVWLCQCSCGNMTEASVANLRAGRVQSCGCLQLERIKEKTTTHGDSHNRLYNIYHHIKQRCYNLKDDRYLRYGGRGIKVCDEWLGEKGYLVFKQWSISHRHKEKLVLDRKDNDGNYEPSNCQWITRSQNSAKTHIDQKANIDNAFMAGFALGYALRKQKR